VLFTDPIRTHASQIKQWHGACEVSLNTELGITTRAVIQSHPVKPEIATAVGDGSSLKEIDAYFQSSKREIELAAIFTIIANMEARIRIDAMTRQQNLAANGILGGRLKIIHAKAKKPWQVPLYENGILDAWKLAARSLGDHDVAAAVGRLSELLKFRHWTAHGRYWLLKRNVADVTSGEASAIVQHIALALDGFCHRHRWPSFPADQ
jgi:hypothetical protein